MLQKFIHQFNSPQNRNIPILQRLHLDSVLLAGLVLLCIVGLFILYSASNENLAQVDRQIIRLVLAFVVMFVCAQIPPQKYQHWAPWLYLVGVLLLIAVLFFGDMGKGARRWLDLGLFRFQPSEIMKLALPLSLAWFFQQKPLPPKVKHLLFVGVVILIPVILIAKEPDLGTAIMIGAAGACVLLFAGMQWRWILGLLGALLASAPLIWHHMRAYQQQRVLTFLNPERDPLGSGYHIIQSKIAIGSGGIFGQGWLHGTQSQLHFLPEHATDFIFAVGGEEFGLIGAVFLILLYIFLSLRGLYIASKAQDTFCKLLAASLSLTFFISAFVNIGMVTGILPVVGLPLPLVSYGGTSMVTLLAGFGIIMSIHTHRKLYA